MTARLVRWGLPLGVTAAGVIVLLLGNTPVGEAVICTAPCIAVAGWLIRLGSEDVKDRIAEEDARRFMDEHGHWPDEAPPS